MTATDIENAIGKFDEDKTYVLSGKKLNAIKEVIKRTNPIGAGTRDAGSSGTEISETGGFEQPGFLVMSGLITEVVFILKSAPVAP